MNDKVKVITREGKEISLEEWQRLYNLPPGSNRIGEFFYLSEHRFKQDIELYGELIVNEMLIRLLDGIRKAGNHPIYLNSFNRSEEKQAEFRKMSSRFATTSPHVVKLAADIDTLSKEDTGKLVKRIREVSNILKIKCRIGWKGYMEDGNTFVHVDVCPEYYAPGKPWHDQPHPAVWELTNEW